MSSPQEKNHTTEADILVIQDLKKTQAYRLERLILILGRSPQADIQILSQDVSRIQATLLRVRNAQGEPQYRLIDGDARAQKPSQNGTYVNGQRIRNHDLKNLDHIVFGSRAKARFFHFSQDFADHLPSIPERWNRSPDSPGDDHETTRINRDRLDWDSLKKPPSTPLETTQSNPSEEVPTNILDDAELASSAAIDPQQAPITFATNKLEKHGRLGEFFVRTNKINPQTLQQLLKQQANSKKRLGELMVEQELISAEELSKALRNQKVCLGEILLQRQLISPEQLTMALVEQVAHPQPLGEILVHWNWITEKDLEDALQEQYLRHRGFWFIQ